MQWKIRYNDQAVKRAKKLDPTARNRIRTFLEARLASMEDPRELGTQLVGSAEVWRYRVGDYRILCQIHQDIITVTVIDIGHRSTIYRRR